MDVGDLAHEGDSDRVREGQLDRLAPWKEGGGRLDASPHQRVGAVRPGDPDANFLERLERPRPEIRNEPWSAARHPTTVPAIGPTWSKLGASG